MNGSAVAEREFPLCTAHAWLDRPAVVDASHTWSWREVHVAAHALAAQLDSTATLCNLCDSQLGFLVVWLAALRQRSLQLLPPSSGRADLRALLRASPSATVVVDDDAALKPEWREHARCLVWKPQRSTARHDNESLDWSADWTVE
jgi:hypothetical protein